MATSKNSVNNTDNPRKNGNNAEQLPALLTIKKAAEIMGVSRDFMYKKVLANGDIPIAVIGGKRWVLRDPLLRKLGCIAE